MSLRYTLGQIARIVTGTLSGDAALTIESVVTDSREQRDNSLFIALRGERFDGHDFATLAVTNGARAVLVHKQIDGLMCPYILVQDTEQALRDLGTAKRKAFRGMTAGITGSSGKTTTRRLLHGILSKGQKTLQPIKNFNNHIGVPLTLMELDDSYGAAVIELGCSDFGEIADLTDIADPDVGLVTNVGPAHLEKLGSLDGVAEAKGELFLNMREDATAVINIDDPRVAGMPVPQQRKIRYSAESAADVRLLRRAFIGEGGQLITLDILGATVEIPLRLLGAHNARNALAAAAAAAAFGIGTEDICTGLSAVEPQAGRLVPCQAAMGAHIIDDTYNANPASMRAALSTLRECAGTGRTAAVLGDMLELGAESDAAHLEIGRFAASLKLDLLVAVGNHARATVLGAMQGGMDPTACAFVLQTEDATASVSEMLRPGDWALIKGSRGMKMETVVGDLMKGIS